MKTKITFLLALAFIACQYSYAQSMKQNIDFEDGNLNLWDGKTGVCCGGGITNPGLVDGRHTIVSGTGKDPNSLDSIPVLAPNGKMYSVRLGNDNVGSEAESISRSFMVTKQNASFVYQYALVLQDPDGHPQIDKPKFEVKIMDSTSAVIPGPCGYYQVTAGPATNDWFKNDDIRFKKWTTVGVDLSAYIGQTMTIQFSTEDCGWGGHYGYAYIDAGYGFLDVVVHGYCEGNDLVQLTGPEGFVQYYWPGTNQSGKTITIPKPNEGDSVIVELTNEAGCSTKLVHLFEKLPFPEAVAGNDTTVCVGNTVNLWADGAGKNGTYHWTSSPAGFTSTNQNLILKPAKTTTYKVRVENANGCVGPDSIASVTVTVDTTMAFSLIDQQQICAGDSVTIAGPVKAGVTYAWTSIPAGINKNTKDIRIAPADSTLYFLTINNVFCSNKDSSQVNIYSPSSLPDTLTEGFCQGDTFAIVNGPVGYASYLWSSGATTQNDTVNNVVNGQIVTLYLQNTIGCTDSIKYVISQTIAPTGIAMVSNDSICLGVSVRLVALGGNSYKWTALPSFTIAPGSSPWVTPDVSSKFILQSYNKYGCTDTLNNDTVDVFVNTNAITKLPPDTLVCSGSAVTIAPYQGSGTFSWISSPVGFVSSDSSITVQPKTTTTYFLIVDNGGCSYSDDIVVQVYNSGLDSAKTVDYCAGAASVFLDGASGFTAYKWSSAQTTEDLTINNPSGSFDRSLYVTTALGCKDTVVYHVKGIQPSVLSALSAQTICYGDNVKLTATTSYAKDKFQWSSVPAGFSSLLKAPAFSPLDTTVFTVTITNDLSCVAHTTESVTVNVDNSTATTLGTDKNICKGEVVNLTSSTGSGTRTWTSTPAGFNSSASSVNVSPPVTTVYHLTISNSLCSNSDDVTVNVKTIDKPEIQVMGSQYCKGDNILLGLTAYKSSYSYDWKVQKGSSLQTYTTGSVTDNLSTSTTYTVKVKDNGCEDSDTLVLTPLDISFSVPASVNSCAGSIVTLDAGNAGATYLWSDNSTAQTLSVTNAGYYSVQVTKGNCTKSAASSVTFAVASQIGFVPNAISPNFDGENDVFGPTVVSNEYHLRIYDRFGVKVFDTTSPSAYWDGRINGIMASDGVYYYTMKLKTDCETQYKELNGYIQVVGSPK